MAIDNGGLVSSNQVGVVVEQDITIIAVSKPFPMTRFFVEGLAVIIMAMGLEGFCRIYGPYKRGFYCDDQSIRHTYKPNTVSVLDLVLYSLLINFCTVFIVEGYRLQKSNLCDEIYSHYEHGRTRVGRLIVRSTIFSGYAAACLLIVCTLTTVTKYSTGRLRPHFMEICKPSVGYSVCNTTNYITDYECTSGYLPSTIQEARLSFFSGHSSIALTSATFFCFYLQDRLVGQTQNRIFVHILQTLNVSLALFIAYSRVNDNWHHWTDVAVGSLVGIIVCSLLCKYYVGLMPKVVRIMESERLHLLSRHEVSQTTVCSVCRNQYNRTPSTGNTSGL